VLAAGLAWPRAWLGRGPFLSRFSTQMDKKLVLRAKNALKITANGALVDPNITSVWTWRLNGLRNG
jgi:hypothetical protein